VFIDSPTSGSQVAGIVTVTADANDNVGVAGVQFFVDGTPAGAEDTTEPFGFNWDTRTVANGVHILTARARDGEGNTTLSAPVNVNVANTSFFQNEVLATGFDLPTAIRFLPDGRLLVVELAGKIKVLPPPYTTPDPTLFLNLTNVGSAGVQQGIYDIQLDPNFATNRFYYIFYTAGSPNHDRLSRFTANATLNGTVAGSELILYEDPQNANAEHHGGAITFGNDGKIYFTTGEHFNGADSQLLTSPRGKLHRINPDGTIPTDNPFFDGPGPNVDSMWALGLRNPFRAYFDAPTNRLFIGDVGGNDFATAQEEVNLGARGANYGWPNCELGTCGNPNFTAALYAYAHNGRDASITGGFVYHGTQYPASFQGSYFFADYTQNWIRRLTFDAQGNVTGVFNFEPTDGSVDGPYGDIVYLTEGPDGALYYVDLGYSDISQQFGVSKIRRIRFIQSNLPPTAISSANPTQGPLPLTVNFSSAGSTDPEGLPLTFSWAFGDGATSTAANPSHTYTQAGQYTARLTVSDGENSTIGSPISISVGNPPVPVILTPTDGALFVAGDVMSYSGNATDTEDGTLPASAFTWNIDFLHEGHVHPGTPVTGVKSGSFTIPTTGHDYSGFTRYRIKLTVTDSNGLQTSTSVLVFPNKVNLSFDTIPSGLTLHLDGIAKTTPFVYDTLKGFQHTVEARNQTFGGTPYVFASWSDGGAQTHTITVPLANQSYSATFNVSTPSSITMGETTVFPGDDSGNGNLLLAQNATLSQPATIQSLSFFVNTASGNLRLGIYDATGPNGGPGALKAQTNAFAAVVGWNTANVITPVSLPAGNYWLAYLPSSNNLHFATNFSIGQYEFANFAFGPMPATFPAIAGQGTTHWSLYGTLSIP
jgi:glucose/arabinose dehydrogenase